MAYSYVKTISNGTQRNYSVPFPYISKAHVFVFVNGADLGSSNWSWLDDTTIRLDAAAVAKAEVRVQRLTPAEDPIVTFTTGPKAPSDLNTAILQSLYLMQEAWDLASEAAIQVGKIDASYYLIMTYHYQVAQNQGIGIFHIPVSYYLPANLAGTSLRAKTPPNTYAMEVRIRVYPGGNFNGTPVDIGTANLAVGSHNAVITAATSDAYYGSAGDIISLDLTSGGGEYAPEDWALRIKVVRHEEDE